jgi:nucleoside-diphosphate kinase
VNRAGTFASDRVHDREIALTRASRIGEHLSRSLAVRWLRRYKRRNLPSLLFKDEIMAIERTFSIIKPDATERNLTGAINALIEKAGLRIVAQKRIRMTREQAETFYAVHKARPFFRELVDFMISAPVVVQVLEGENAVLRHRDVMGATDPSKAADGTIRKLHAKSIGENSVHGSDAAETAAIEIAQFFSGNEIVG